MRQPRLLVADDQPDVLEALRWLLTGEGYEPEFVSSTDAVLERLRERSFDLLLMDLNYSRDTTSGREGLELIPKVRALDAALPIVVMTGWGSVDTAVEAMRHGARSFVQKPWEDVTLLEILQREIEEAQATKRSDARQKREFEDARLIVDADSAGPSHGRAALLTDRAQAEFDNVIVSPTLRTTMYANDFEAGAGPWTRTGLGFWNLTVAGSTVYSQSSIAGDARASIGAPAFQFGRPGPRRPMPSTNADSGAITNRHHASARPRTRLQLVPPKPNELLSTRDGAWGSLCWRYASGSAGSSLLRLTPAGMKPLRNANTLKAASTPPAA